MQLNKDIFDNQVTATGILIPKALTANLLKTLHPYLLKLRNQRCVVNLDGPSNLLLIKDMKELP